MEPELVLEFLPLRAMKEKRGEEDTGTDVLAAGGEDT